MPTLLITRGLPASGKSTWARYWVAENPRGRARVNRDDIRASLFGAPILDHHGEKAVTAAQQAQVCALLDAGRDVVVDDTNLSAKYARAWADLAETIGAGFTVVDHFLSVPVDECLRRDQARAEAGGREVGEKVIRGMHDKFIAPGNLAPVVPGKFYGGSGDAVDRGAHRLV